tara:strand:+ start:853 stop:1365 length:513 start_codon:yes stop_codon:yes gene_type:complete
MKLGKIRLVFIVLILSISNSLKAEDRILSAPIINLENLKPSYEELENDISLNDNNYNQIKERELEINKIKKFKYVNLVGLDKITAKTKKIKVKLGEKVKFGFLEIKALRCGISTSNNKNDPVAYIQVKDLSEGQNEKVFIFNGWTFSSNPSLTPLDHAVYDVWLENCEGA